MAAIWRDIRSGNWLTLGRLRAYAFMLLAGYAVAVALWIGLSHGLIDRKGKPIGTDFSSVYAAGTLARSGQADAAYDWGREHAVEQAIFADPKVPFYAWLYPPLFLTVAAALANLSYAAALALWMLVTLAAYLIVMHAIEPRPPSLLLALAFPAVFINLGNGQNGFFSAALLGGALLQLDSRPLFAGVLIGLMAYKPQFGVLIPLALVASGRWRTFFAAAATVPVAAGASLALFGAKTWTAFLASTILSRTIGLEAGGTGWQKIQSLFSAVRMWGGSVDAAYTAQGALALATAAALVWLWRSEAAYELKAAALVVASLLATPYVLDYDLMMLAVALAFFARHGLARGFGNYEITLLAFVWCVPIVTRPLALATDVPLGLIAQCTLFVLIVDRARRECGAQRRSKSLAPA